MRILGNALAVAVIVTAVAACLAVSWFLLVGGVLDVAGGRTIGSGIGRIDDWNIEYRERWGRLNVGLLKIFVLEPAAILLIVLLARPLVRGARSVGRPEPGLAPATRPPVDDLDAFDEIRLGSAQNPVAAASPEPVDRAPALWDATPTESETEDDLAPEDDLIPERDLPPEAGFALPRAGTAGEPDDEPSDDDEPRDEELDELERGPGIGSSLLLHGFEGEQALVEVALLEVSDQPPGGGDERQAGQVVVRLGLRNAGEMPFEDVPTGGARLVGDDGRSYRAVAARTQDALGELRLAPGERCEGVLAFRLPPGVAPWKFRFSPSLGLSKDDGEWDLDEEETAPA